MATDTSSGQTQGCAELPSTTGLLLVTCSAEDAVPRVTLSCQPALLPRHYEHLGARLSPHRPSQSTATTTGKLTARPSDAAVFFPNLPKKHCQKGIEREAVT